MVEPTDLEKLFDAAIHQRKAPSRFGTPDEQLKAGPAVFQREEQPVADILETTAPSPFTPVFQAAPPEEDTQPEVVLCEHGAASLDQSLNAELAVILDAKIAKEKKSKKIYRIAVLSILLLSIGGGTGWVVLNPERYQAFKEVLSEIRSVADIGQMTEKYQKSLDKVAERGKQIDAASAAMGVDVSKVDENDPSLDKAMQNMMGEEGGKTTGERNKILKDKFKSVEEGGKIGGGGQ